MIPLLHPAGNAWRGAARRASAALAEALGRGVTPVPLEAGRREATARGETPGGAWALVPGPDLLAATPLPPDRIVVLPRRDPRWALEDLARRTLDRLPPGVRVVVPSDLGEALLRRARPDLVPVRAGSFPVAEETPVLAEGPREVEAGAILDAPPFLPAPGTGIEVLLSPAGLPVPEPVRALEDAGAKSAFAIERAFAEGVGPLGAGAALGVLGRRKVAVLFQVHAFLLLPGAPARELKAEIPLADARAFARAFGKHLRAATHESRNSA